MANIDLFALLKESGIEIDAEDFVLNHDYLSDQLNDAVHECKASEAANINNDGFASQFQYLCEKLGTQEVKNIIKDIMRK